MLTKDLIRYSTYNDKIKPRFINVSDKMLYQLADLLIKEYKGGVNLSRSELQERVKPLLVSISKDLKLTKGFNKLLLDRSEFSHVQDINFENLRKNIFNSSASLLKESYNKAISSFREEVMKKSGEKPQLAEQLYSDLPENESLIKFKDIYPLQLLQRYNCALVQSLLLYSGCLNLIVFEPDISKIRRMFKYLKFFRLLARIFNHKTGNKTGLKIIIDGPISLFENTQKYGLQLASFFPAICDMKEWQIESEIKFKSSHYSFNLNHKSGIVGHYQNFGAYIPPEIIYFHKNFKEKVKEWEIVGETPFLDIGNQQIIFPDLSFKHSDGKIIHLELFHRWHSTQLLERLKYLDKNHDLPLIIGVDRYLHQQQLVQDAIKSYSWFENKAFLFNDFPIVSSAQKCLERALK